MTEELVGIGTSTAVGRTPDVTGSLTLAGSTITAASFEADLTSLQSDSGMRDGQLGRQGLETDTYPTATFVLAEPIELDAVPAEGEAIAATAVGDLTLHGVTKRVEIPLEAQLSNGVVTVVGSLPVAFGDYGMTAPGRCACCRSTRTARWNSSFSSRRPGDEMHLLVVEDDERLRRALRRLLEADRHVVELAPDGGTALELADATDGIDAVILDIGLPDINGFEVARRLRTDEASRSSCSPPATRSAIASPASMPVPTTTS